MRFTVASLKGICFRAGGGGGENMAMAEDHPGLLLLTAAGRVLFLFLVASLGVNGTTSSDGFTILKGEERSIMYVFH